MTKTEQEIYNMTKPLIEDLGYIFYDVMYLKEAGEWYLRFFIDKDNSKVDLDDCEKVSERLSDFLDEKDPIKDSYNLEVSSCGLERHLREPMHFEWARGKEVLVKLFKTQDGVKEIQGILDSYENDSIRVINNESKKEYEISTKDVSMCKILYNWEELENE